MDTLEHKRYFSTNLLLWYNRHKRDLPWRRSKNPYYIWVSEIMLQQTRVETVKPYFERFVGKFPTVDALADAPEEEVLKSWEGLGYYSRARNLQSAAREVKEQYGGQVPDTKPEISALKGIGPYTAGAILSIAYNKPEPAVDGNVMRVLSRYFLIEEDIMKNSTRAQMERLVVELIPEGEASNFNQALMELGALVCTPKSPQCLTCPVMEHCAARFAGLEDALPVKTKAKPPKPEYRLAALIEGSGANAGKVLVRQRPAAGLLARMWELPHILGPSEAGEGQEETNQLQLRGTLAQDGWDARPQELFMTAEHTFSHIHWNMSVYRCAFLGGAVPEIAAGAAAEADGSAAGSAAGSAGGQAPPSPLYRWIDRADMEQLAFPNVFLRILNRYFG
ncbi:A/G-specific adenine glycosylase [Paenibacillus sp. MSJ-34]|uniref:A/G-specific adenine glycosylase n=1 Tax=Paenibacillus sp. MSJ-34 TaxID=2841529 RepID=UPI001C0FA957|nr:A/G-specific adenine glycosylase [Paenibacillus sp. MSJ-34]MBU5443316.1 A/G-specific adenine glycosylase [Paenibacillus sp. MSJ-34]